MKLIELHPNALAAAMRGGTDGWGQRGSASDHVRYSLPIDKSDRRRRKCNCGCGKRSTHRGLANGVCLTEGCQMHIARWVRDPRAALQAARSKE